LGCLLLILITLVSALWIARRNKPLHD